METSLYRDVPQFQVISEIKKCRYISTNRRFHIFKIWPKSRKNDQNRSIYHSRSIPHCPIDEALATKRCVPPLQRFVLIKLSKLEYLSSLVFHTVILTKYGPLKWSISAYLSSLVFHTALLTILFRSVV